MNNIIVDSGFWFALYDSRDYYHHNANEIAEYLRLGNILIPYPTLYETINTRFSRRVEWLSEFQNLINQNNVILIDDSEYKDDALNLTFDTNNFRNFSLSLVDMTIRLMLDDKNLNINYLISFNERDFIDICQRNFISLLTG